MIFKMIVAVDINNGIGKDNKIPWYYSEDLKYFAKQTKGTTSQHNAIVMGRKTYESIGRALPGRYNYVLSKTLKNDLSENTKHVGSENQLHIFPDLDALLNDVKKRNFDEVWIIGGATIYKQLLEFNPSLIQFIYVTKILKKYDCDTFFPTIDTNIYKKILVTYHETLELNYIIYQNMDYH